jgi:hypothetical protein
MRKIAVCRGIDRARGGLFRSCLERARAVDTWQIEIDAQYDTHGGHVTAYRNGTAVYDATAGVCDSAAVGCWWNFGPYMFYWQTTEEPPGYNSAGVSVDFNGMTLTTPSGGGGTLSRKRHT